MTETVRDRAVWCREWALLMAFTRRQYRPNIASDREDDVLRRAIRAYARHHYPVEVDEILRLYDAGDLEHTCTQGKFKEV